MPSIPSVPEEPSLPDKVSESFKNLASKAVELNTTSDEFGRFIRSMDASLQRLNLGIEAWVRMKGGWEEPDGDYEHHLIGYAKVNQTWGIALRISRGNEHQVEYGERLETWLFNDAPRTLRVDAIDALPELLDRLAKKAETTTKKLADKTDVARDLSVAMQQAAKDLAAKKK